MAIRVLALIVTTMIVGFLNQQAALQKTSLVLLPNDGDFVNAKSVEGRHICNETTLGNVLDDGRVSKYRPMPEFLDGPGVLLFEGNDTSTVKGISSPDRNAPAVCRFQSSPNSNHFPHAMEQLYRCWSFWRWADPSRRQPILVWPDQKFVGYFNPSQRQSLRTRLLERSDSSDLAKSMIHAWQETIGLRVVTPDHPLLAADNNNDDNSSMVWTKNVAYTPFVLSSPDDARALANLFLSHPEYSFLKRSAEQKLKPDHDFIDTQQRAGCQHAEKNDHNPRIILLNREIKSKRTMLNILAIGTDLEQRLGQTVDVVYLEGRNFWEQISLFASTDIVLTVHGAQLSAMPFMPACGAVFEMFGNGYYLPWYFRSLAQASGLRHYSAYAGTDVERDSKVAMFNGTTRHIARSANVCPKVDDVVRVAQRMVQDWRECCATRPSSDVG